MSPVSVLGSTDGELEYLFVLEDKADPAYAMLTQLAAQQQQQQQREQAAAGRAVRIILSGQAAGTSQKIHK
jgi:hypothetical protein